MIYIFILMIVYIALYYLSIQFAYKLADVDNSNSSFYCHKKDSMKNNLLNLLCIVNIIPFGSVLLVLLNQLLFESK